MDHEVKQDGMPSMQDVNKGRQVMSNSSHVDKGKRPTGDATLMRDQMPMFQEAYG